MSELIESPNITLEPTPWTEISDPAVLAKIPLVSVHMITYNHAPYIAQAIEGVLQQKTNFPIELIIGEDCSTDDTRKIVFEYQKKYPDIIRIITSEKNVGAKKNSYRTTKAWRGRYIAFCEGDDYWHNNCKLQIQAEYLDCHSEYGLSYSSYDVYHVKKNVKIKDFNKYRKWEHPENVCVEDFVKGNNPIVIHILTCTVMVRRDLCERIIESDPYLHQSGHFLMGDTQLWAELANIAKFHYVPESLATHCITENSATRSKDIKKVLRFHISGAELMKYLCDKYALSPEIKKIHENNCRYNSLMLAFYSKNFDMADEVRKKSISFSGKDWIKYLGAKNIIFYYGYIFWTMVRKIYKKEYVHWQ